MTELNIMQIFKNLKIKNCEDFDRIRLRIFNEGAEILIAPLAQIFKLIYIEKRIQEQWKTAKVKLLPYHRKVISKLSPIFLQYALLKII